MNSKKIRSAEILFDAIGMIDDRIIAEAQVPYRAPKSKNAFKFLIAFSCVFAVIALSLGSFMIADLTDKFFPLNEEDHLPPATNYGSFEQLLNSAASNSAATQLESKEINFFDGDTKLIWRFENESKYNVITVSSDSQIKQIRAAIKNNSYKISPEAADSVECQVWIAYGNGTVVSPYLADSAGNIGYAELFEYSPEVEPNEDFVKVIEEIVVD